VYKLNLCIIFKTPLIWIRLLNHELESLPKKGEAEEDAHQIVVKFGKHPSKFRFTCRCRSEPLVRGDFCLIKLNEFTIEQRSLICKLFQYT